MTTDRSATSPGTRALGLTSTRIDGLDFIATRVFDAPQLFSPSGLCMQ